MCFSEEPFWVDITSSPPSVAFTFNLWLIIGIDIIIQQISINEFSPPVFSIEGGKIFDIGIYEFLQVFVKVRMIGQNLVQSIEETVFIVMPFIMAATMLVYAPRPNSSVRKNHHIAYGVESVLKFPYLVRQPKWRVPFGREFVISGVGEECGRRVDGIST